MEKNIEKIVKENEALIRWGNNKVDKYGFIIQKNFNSRFTWHLFE